MILQSNKALPFKLKDVLGCCEQLSDFQKTAVLGRISMSTANENINDCGALFVWVADLLQVLKFFESEKLWYILDNYKGQILCLGTQLGTSIQNGEPKLPVAVLGIADRRFVTITCDYDYNMLDMTTGTCVKGVSTQFLETLQYNLTTLFTRRYLAIKAA